MCPIKCNICFDICYKRLEHEGEHSCSFDSKYDHLCDEKCAYCNCEKTPCKTENCEKKCLEYSGHEGTHTCKHGHQCDGICECFEYSNNCENKCKKPFPHPNDPHHNCLKNPHHCKGICKYSDKETRGCLKECKLEYPHPQNLLEHDCKGTHLCKKNCDLKGKARIEDNAEEEYCNKPYGHEENENDKEHNCGKTHLCDETCHKNCEQKCKLLYGHQNIDESNPKFQGKLHDCGKSNHTCGKNCRYFGKSKECHKNCYKDYDSKHDCICDFEREDKSHFCNKKCSLCNNRDCCLLSGHEEGKCACNECKCQEDCRYCLMQSGNRKQTCRYKAKEKHNNHICVKDSHICNKGCNYQNCNRTCQKILENEPHHTFCDCRIIHKCNNSCFFNNSEIRCSNPCSIEVNQNGQHKNNEPYHLCELKDKHKCNQYCYLRENSKPDSCKNNCKFEININNYDSVRKTHQGYHICESISHECNKKCIKYYRIENNMQVQCNKDCSLPPKHNENCKCNGESQHVCHCNCQFFDNNTNCRDCRQYCSRRLGSPHTEHNCGLTLEQHKCNKKCPYCDTRCSRSFHHTEPECLFECNPPHKCGMECTPNDGKCRGICTKPKGHGGNFHLCDLPENKHSCKEKCKLCNKPCGHAYGHQRNDITYLECNKCGRTNCKLIQNINKNGGRFHLCGDEHDCVEIGQIDKKNECEIPGFCQVSTPTEIGGREEIFRTNSGYVPYKVFPKGMAKKLECKIKIPSCELSHVGKHKCFNNSEEKQHKCGFECKQCGHFCLLENGHPNPDEHVCYHGNIQDAKIFIMDDSQNASIKKDNVIIQLNKDDSAEIFTCNDYCQAQDPGHTHLLTQIPFFDVNNVRRITKNKQVFYECKCSYFWKHILKFKAEINQEKSDKCNCYCDGNHDDDNKIKKGEKAFCKLPLWHKSKEHVFGCDHSNGIYTIFLVDRSGSMSSEKIKPLRKDLEYDNMIGVAIQAILSYCQRRKMENPREKCAMIGYDNKAEIIFKDVLLNDETKIKDECIKKLKPRGGTEFLPAFQEAKTVVNNVRDSKGYTPVIILLTDGLDFHPEETIKYIENDVSFIYINF